MFFCFFDEVDDDLDIKIILFDFPLGFVLAAICGCPFKNTGTVIFSYNKTVVAITAFVITK